MREKVWLRLFFEPNLFPYTAQHLSNLVHSTHTYLPMKMEQTECSETSAYKIQTPGNYPEEIIQHSEHGECLKSRTEELFVILIQGTLGVLEILQRVYRRRLGFR